MVVTALLVAGLAPAAPAAATSYDQYSFGEHAEGYPATETPAWRLDAVSLTREDRGEPSTPVRVTADLQGVPDTGTDAVLVVRLGHRETDEAACTTDWEVSTSTLEPALEGGGASRDGARITLDTAAPAGGDWTCGTATLSDAEGRVTDVLDEPQHGRVEPDPAGRATIDAVSGKRVPVRRWAQLWVRVTNELSPVEEVVVTGRGQGVDVRPTSTGPLATGESVVVRVLVRLRADRRREVWLSARTRGQVLLGQTTRRRVWVRPRP